jgi:hypothetical protein
MGEYLVITLMMCRIASASTYDIIVFNELKSLPRDFFAVRSPLRCICATFGDELFFHIPKALRGGGIDE